jgi:hypothetical protein
MRQAIVSDTFAIETVPVPQPIETPSNQFIRHRHVTASSSYLQYLNCKPRQLRVRNLPDQERQILAAVCRGIRLGSISAVLDGDGSIEYRASRPAGLGIEMT